MSATTPNTAAPALTWATAPAEFRRSTYVGLGARALMPLALTATLAWALTSSHGKLTAVFALVAMGAMTVGVIGAAWKYRRTAQMVLPREHQVKVPLRLTVTAQIMSGASEVAFVAILLANQQDFALSYATMICCLGTSGLWTSLYEKGHGRRVWAAAVRTIATLVVVAVWAPESLVGTTIWAASVMVAVNAILFLGSSLDGSLAGIAMRTWASRADLAISRRRAGAAA